MATLFEMHSLSAAYDSNIVLSDVDFKVNENDFIGGLLVVCVCGSQ